MEHGPIKVGMVIIMQHDLGKAVEFYRDVLQLPLKFHLENKWAEFDLGCVKFGLCPIAEKQDNIRTGIVLEVQHDLLKMYENLKDKVTFLNEPVVAVHGIMIGFKDVGGNILDLYQPTLDKVKDLVKETVNKGNDNE
jgi:catechol 2,3-dioxygenase-like lactoylglutathione lyase family enzyme